MSEYVSVEISPNSVPIIPGQGRRVSAQIRNVGTDPSDVDSFNIEVVGIDESWYSLTTSRMALFPGDTGTALIDVNVPRHCSSTAGNIDFNVSATSTKHPNETGQGHAVLDIQAFHEFETSLERSHADDDSILYILQITNNGNDDLNLVAYTLLELVPVDQEAVEVGDAANVAQNQILLIDLCDRDVLSRLPPRRQTIDNRLFDP